MRKGGTNGGVLQWAPPFKWKPKLQPQELLETAKTVARVRLARHLRPHGTSPFTHMTLRESFITFKEM
eukprot:3191680-Amphidinium_carterae.1